MWGYIGAALFILWTLYLVTRYGLKPYLRMLGYTKYKGAIWVEFFPIVGPFQESEEESFQLTADEHFFSKRPNSDQRDSRFFIFNAFDKCFLLIVDPALLQDFFQKQEYYMKDEQFVKNKGRFFGKGLVFSEGEEWSPRRKVMSDIFHHSFYSKFIPKICDIIEREIARLKGHDLSTFQAKQLSARISGDAVIKTFFGISYNQKINDQPLSLYMHDLILDIMAQQRSLRYFLFGIKVVQMGLFPEDKNVKERLVEVKNLIKNSIQGIIKEESLEEEGSVLFELKDNNYIQTKDGYSLEELVEQFMGFFVAGTETTAQLMSMCFYYMSFYAEHQKSLREEVISSGVLEKLDFRTISSMKFLEAFVKETYRHYNYMISSYPRICQKKHELGEIVIQEGDVVIPGWAHSIYNQRYFPHPDNFEPERWLKADQRQMNYVFTPITTSSRSCLGQNFALLQTKIMVIKIMQHFSLKLRDGNKHLLKAHALDESINSILIDLKDA